jgi:hypothetical protein
VVIQRIVRRERVDLGVGAGRCEEVHGLPRRGCDAADRTDVRPWMVVGGGWKGEESRRCRRREVGDSRLTAQAHKQASVDQGGRGPSVHSPAAVRLMGTRALPVDSRYFCRRLLQDSQSVVQHAIDHAPCSQQTRHDVCWRETSAGRWPREPCITAKLPPAVATDSKVNLLRRR